MEFPRKKRRHGGLELTPLIDVVFLLIVFLILTANFQMPSLTMSLPRAASDDKAAEDVVLVELAEDGSLALNGAPVVRESFSSELRSALEPLTFRAIRLMADERVDYGELFPIIEQAREAGATAVDLVHQGR